MTTLQTYENGPNVLLTTVRSDAGKRLAPGRWVSQGSGDDVLGLGIVVGVTDTEVAVLWSVAPFVNPMSVSEDYFLPLKVPAEMLRDVGSAAQQAKEELDYFVRSLKRATRAHK